MHTFTLYILHSPTLDSYYIGYTSTAIEVRLKKHLVNHKGFTAKAKDWAVVYTKDFDTKKEAMEEERRLKLWKSKLRVREFILRSSTE